jgi:hypothetical protein
VFFSQCTKALGAQEKISKLNAATAKPLNYAKELKNKIIRMRRLFQLLCFEVLRQTEFTEE